MHRVLVLNATYEPLSIVSVQRAVVLLLKEKAELVESAEERLHAAYTSLPVPLVIRLVYYVRIPRPVMLAPSRRSVMARDNFTCQYCGATPGRAASDARPRGAAQPRRPDKLGQRRDGLPAVQRAQGQPHAGRGRDGPAPSAGPPQLPGFPAAVRFGNTR